MRAEQRLTRMQLHSVPSASDFFHCKHMNVVADSRNLRATILCCAIVIIVVSGSGSVCRLIRLMLSYLRSPYSLLPNAENDVNINTMQRADIITVERNERNERSK